MAYLVVTDEDNDLCVTANLFDGIKVAHSVNFVESSVGADTGASLAVADGTISLALELAPSALTPLLEEVFFVGVIALVIVRLALTLVRCDVVGLGSSKAEDAISGIASPIHPLELASRLIRASISNDTLHASGPATVERCGRELELGGGGGYTHGFVDFGVSVGFFFGNVRVGLEIVGLAILGVGCRMGGAVLGYQVVELFLGCRRCHWKKKKEIKRSRQRDGRTRLVLSWDKRGEQGAGAAGSARAGWRRLRVGVDCGKRVIGLVPDRRIGGDGLCVGGRADAEDQQRKQGAERGSGGRVGAE